MIEIAPMVRLNENRLDWLPRHWRFECHKATVFQFQPFLDVLRLLCFTLLRLHKDRVESVVVFVFHTPLASSTTAVVTEMKKCALLTRTD